MIDLKQLLLRGSATAVVAAASFSTAQAQSTAPLADSIETVNSSASRVELKGLNRPRR